VDAVLGYDRTIFVASSALTLSSLVYTYVYIDIYIYVYIYIYEFILTMRSSLQVDAGLPRLLIVGEE